MGEINYKANDDLNLYDSVIERLELNHINNTITFHILKVISRVDRGNGFTYKVKKGRLIFSKIIYTNVNYNMALGEWSEFYRSAVLMESELLQKIKQRPSKLNESLKEDLKHIYLGIDNIRAYSESDIICAEYSLILDSEEFILHDDFDWLFD